MTVIYYLSSIPGKEIAPMPDGSDKVIHFIIYLFLGIFFQRALKKFNFLFPIILGIFYGASDEFHQSFVPGRFPSVWDWVADAMGIITGVLIIKYIYEKKYDRT